MPGYIIQFNDGNNSFLQLMLYSFCMRLGIIDTLQAVKVYTISFFLQMLSKITNVH